MNIDERAQQILLKLMEAVKTGYDAEGISECAYEIADAMQAESDKRKPKGLPEVLLTKDKDGNCLHFHREFGRKKCMDCGASLEEWQPDWSQAPEWANSWGMAEIGQAWWLSGEWHVNNRGGFSSTGFIKAEKAPSFDYQGNWKESLRERP